MIKINLLPAHILERQRLRSVIVLAVVVLLIEAAILGMVMTRVNQQLADREIELKYWQDRAAAVGQVEQSINTTNGQAAFYGRWVDWKAAIEKYHDSWAEVLGDIARWIYAKVQLDSMSPTPAQVQIAGRTDSLESFRKAYLNIIRSDVLTNVTFTITGVAGGFSEGQTLAPARAAGVRAAAAAARPPTPAASGLRFGFGRSGMGGRAAGAAPAAPRLGAAAAQAGTGPLPVGVTFQCALRPEIGGRLNPPVAPIGGAPVAGGPGGLARPGGGAAPPGAMKFGRFGGGAGFGRRR
jgi:Tfp pilus assembly protein PilN